MGRRIVLAIIVAGLTAGCGVLPAPLVGGEVIVMQVANQSARPATLVVGAMGGEGTVMGSVDPAIVPPRTTVMVRFVVPPTGQWAIFANGGELMGSFDLEGRRGNVPMGISVDPNGNLSWWCEGACP